MNVNRRQLTLLAGAAALGVAALRTVAVAGRPLRAVGVTGRAFAVAGGAFASRTAGRGPPRFGAPLRGSGVAVVTTTGVAAARAPWLLA